MLVDDSVAAWSWSLPPSPEPLRDCLAPVFAALPRLAAHGLGTAVTGLSLALHDTAQPPTTLHRGSYPVEGRSLRRNALRITEQLHKETAGLPLGGGLLTLHCTGSRRLGSPPLTLRSRFSLATTTIGLEIHDDVWDAELLAGVLGGLSALYGVPTTPGPPTPYAVPTPTGAEPRHDLPLLLSPVSGRRLDERSPVYVPAHPQDQHLVHELYGSPGGPVAVAFSTLELLVARLGPAQPWISVPAGEFITLMHRLGAEPVRLDPEIAPDAPRWAATDLERIRQQGE